MATQRFESSVTAISWIPSEAITGPSKVPFEAGRHPLRRAAAGPDRRSRGAANERPLPRSERAAGVHRGGGRPDRERRASRPGPHRCDDRQGRAVRTAVPGGPAARHPAGAGDGRFVGALCPDGRRPDGPPTPRPVPHKPFVQFWPSIAWTTLSLTINADGSSSHELIGASPFPRHWIYDHRERSSRSRL